MACPPSSNLAIILFLMTLPFVAGLSGLARAGPEFTLRLRPESGVGDCDLTLHGLAEEKLRVDVLALLETRGNPTELGVSGWTLSIHGENLRVVPGQARRHGINHCSSGARSAQATRK